MTAHHPPAGGQDLSEAIDALLPQTQCRQCGFAGCQPYAAAVARGDADINRCPPGGEAGVRRLAALLKVAFKPLDPACGAEKPPAHAVVDEPRCIGCTLCIQACPVDAIVGAAKQMHTVVAALCTGCELCLPPCPVDCILMVPLEPPHAAPLDEPARRAAADRARERYLRREARLARERDARAARLAGRAIVTARPVGDTVTGETGVAVTGEAEEIDPAPVAVDVPGGALSAEDKKALIAAALARAREKAARRAGPRR